MEHHDLVPAEAQMLDALENLLLIIEQVADDDHDAAPPDLHRHVVQHHGDVRLRRRIERRQRRQHFVNHAVAVAAGEVIARRRVEDVQRDGVALMQNHIRETRRDHLRVVELRVFARAVLHRLAAIQQDVRDVVRLLLVLLDVVAVRAPEHLPVEMPQIVAVGVFAMLGELNGEAVIGGLVLARHVALDQHPGVQTQRLGARNRDRVEELFESCLVHARSRRRGWRWDRRPPLNSASRPSGATRESCA